MTSHPYRAEAGQALVVTESRRRGITTRVMRALIAGAVVVVAVGGPIELEFAGLTALSIGVCAGIVGSWGRRRRAVNRLAALPFPVVHDRPAAAEPLRWAVPIRSIVVTLGVELAGPERERVGLAVGDGLCAKFAGDRVTVTAWSWGADDLELLAQLLATWGREVHAKHSIVDVRVEWASSGPPLAG